MRGEAKTAEEWELDINHNFWNYSSTK